MTMVTKIHLIIYKKNKIVLVNVINNINCTYLIQILQINEMMHVNVLTLKTMENLIGLSCI